MADIFDNDTIVSKPHRDVVNIIIIQRRYETINALETYKLKENQGYGTHESLIKSKLYSLILEVKQMLDDNIEKFNKHIETFSKKIKYKNKIYNTSEELLNAADSDNIKTIVSAFDYLDRFLYYKEITKIDTKRVAEWTNISKLNEQAGI